MSNTTCATIGYIIDFGTVTNWISAVCSVIVACLAAHAAFKARNWFRSKTHDLIFEKIYTLMRNVNSTVFDLEKTFTECKHLAGKSITMSHMYSGENENFKRVHIIRNEYYKLITKVLDNRMFAKSIKNDIMQISNLGVTITNKEDFDNLIDNTLDLINDWFLIFKDLFLGEHYELKSQLSKEELKEYDTIVYQYSEKFLSLEQKLNPLKESLDAINNTDFNTLFTLNNS